MPRSAIRSTHPQAQEAADDVLRAGGNALGAAITGFFAAAGAEAGVLFSPVSLLVGGLGMGTFAYDGRARQPGRGAKRPRGFVSSSDVPQAARAAVPAGLSALAVACAFHPGTSLLSCSRAGVSVAKALSKRSRAELIDRTAGLGARALFEPALKRELLARFGVVERGSLTVEDLNAPEDLQLPAERHTPNAGHRAALPWQSNQPPSGDAGTPHALVVVDSRGLCVALHFWNLPQTLYLETFEVAFPALAVPVMRGIPRVMPGQVLPSPGAPWLELSRSGLPLGVGVVVGDTGPALRLLRDPESLEVSAAQL